MTIDIRANVYCNLGQIIEGSLSDTYAQDNGLVFCRGSVMLDGILQPAPGQVVDFGYQKAGWLARIPRRLRVLSSFADPFTKQTQVELGCKLTLLKDHKRKRTNPQTGEEYPAVVAYAASDSTNPVPLRHQGYVPPSLSVNTVLSQCLTALGISAPSLPFTARINGAKFAIDRPYVEVLADLLKSLSYVGYLDESENLILRDLTADGGIGPVVGADEIITMEPIGVGEVAQIEATVKARRYAIGPASVANASIDAGTPQKPPGDGEPDAEPDVGAWPPTPDAPVPLPDNDDIPEPPPEPPEPPSSRMLWTYDESIGDPQNVEIKYNPAPPNPNKQTYVLSYVPFVYTKTTYDDNRVTLRTTTERTYAPVVNGSYFKEALEFYDGDVAGSYPIEIVTTEEYEYDRVGNVTKQTQKRYEPQIASVGKSSIKYVYDQNGQKQIYNPPLSTVLAEMNVTEYERWQAVNGNTVIKYNKTKRTTHKLLLHTQEGQQAIAKQAEDAATYQEVIDLAVNMVGTLTIDSVDIQNTSEVSTLEAEQAAPPGRARPAPEDLQLKGLGIDRGDKDRAEDRKPIVIKAKQNNGPAANQNPPPTRETEYDLPYVFDQYYFPTNTAGVYAPTGKSAETQILTYARIQNRLRLAHRAGLSLQLAPELIPVRPFDPIYVNLSGLVGQYRVNATSWAFSSSGIAAQVDAAFWGGVGTT